MIKLPTEPHLLLLNAQFTETFLTKTSPVASIGTVFTRPFPSYPAIAYCTQKYHRGPKTTTDDQWY